MIKLKCITVNTDASFCHKKKQGAYGIYIRSDKFLIKHGGKFKGQIADPNEAEIKAIANAMHILILNCEYSTHSIVINTDSTTAIRFLKHGLKTKKYSSARKLIFQAKKKLGAEKLFIRHVKAHSGTDQPRKYANDWCDKTAKKYLFK